MRTFETGATRSDDSYKLDYEAALSPIVLWRYAKYLHKHRVQADGKIRADDSWQKGVPKDAYMKSLIRHVMNAWMRHRGWVPPNVKSDDPQNLEEDLMAILFNAMGYAFELLTKREEK